MRILKPNKSSVSRSKTGEQAGDLLFSIEEINLDQKDGSLDWMKQLTDSEAEAFKVENTSEKKKKEYNQVFSKGIRLLSMREHSAQEITKKLLSKCDKPDLVYAVVDDLIENNYLSDQRFAESFVRSRQNRGNGPSKIRMELKGKGISTNMINDYLDDASAIWFENAKNQYHKKYGEGPVKDYNTWAKRARFMQSRGFSTEHIQVTIPRVDYD